MLSLTGTSDQLTLEREIAVARLLAFEAIHGLECESGYGGAPVTHCFTSVSAAEMITVRCERCGTWITESVQIGRAHV